MLLYEFDTIAYHDKLNPKLWDAHHNLWPEVREALTKISEHFQDDLDLPDLQIHDVVIRGSNANYNYTKYSDIDLHLITDVDLYADPDMAEKYFNAKKNLWNNAHDVLIHDTDVEVYVEDDDEHNESQGTYSILHDQWLSEPSHNPPNINEREVKQKVQDYVNQIDRAIEDGISPDTIDEVAHLKDKIWKMRQAGLEANGEFSIENMVFKVLRNQGFLDRLLSAKSDAEDQEMSL